MLIRNTSNLVWVPVLMLIAFGVLGCDNNQSRKPAPIGDHAVLEQLATAYRTVAEEYPVQLTGMRPAGKKEFVERVFATAGYHYGATLAAFAKQGADVTSQDQRDLADLLFFPHRGLGEADMKDIYTADELAAIQTIQSSLK